VLETGQAGRLIGCKMLNTSIRANPQKIFTTAFSRVLANLGVKLRTTFLFEYDSPYEPMNDDQLHQLLRESSAPISLPGSFTREVWARIEVAESTSLFTALSQSWHAWLGTLARPAPAVATIAVCMLLGGGFGWIRHREAFHVQGELAYVDSINPFVQMQHEVSQ